MTSLTALDQAIEPDQHRSFGTAPRALHAMQCEVLEAVALGQPLDRVMDLLCRHTERLAPAVTCSILSVDEDGRLHPLAAPSLPDAYSRALDGVPIGPDTGSCGAAAFCGRPIWTPDIDADPRWTPYKAMPLAIGLRGCWSSPIKASDGRVIGTFAFYYRITRAPDALERQIVEASVHLCALAIEHDAVQRRLEQTNRRFDLALSNMSQGLCFFDGAQRLIVANRRFSEIYGLPENAVRPGMTLREIVDQRVAAGTGPAISRAEYLRWREKILGRVLPTDAVVELTNGRMIAIHHRPLADGGWVATHEDITERRQAEARIVYLARHDTLTNLPNRMLFHERMEHALGRSGPGAQCAVLCLDLDLFKAVNDSFGHPIGDKLLQTVAARLRGCVREQDTLTRLGGDEFAVLLVGLDGPETAGDVAQRIVQALSAPYELDGHLVDIGVSIGIAVTPGDGNYADKLLKSADLALYRAKIEERGTYRFFEPQMDARLQARMALKMDLRRALDGRQFELWYQPLVSVETGAVCGFEALLRWHHPIRGMVSPADFIPLAEETGVIVPLGEWVLRAACAEAAAWPDDVKVAVNLSAVQFKRRTLVDAVRDALAASGLPAARLELEITESVLLADSAATLEMLHELRGLGVRIAMDDFGTGYSSLLYLRSFPFDKVKIDQSFIRDLSERADSIAIVRAVVTLCRSLGMATTAEGVETDAQLRLLRGEGCTELQGYLFSRPRPAADIPTMLGSAFAVAPPCVDDWGLPVTKA